MVSPEYSLLRARQSWRRKNTVSAAICCEQADDERKHCAAARGIEICKQKPNRADRYVEQRQGFVDGTSQTHGFSDPCAMLMPFPPEKRPNFT